MNQNSKRQFLKYAGTGLAVAAVGIPGTASAASSPRIGDASVATQVSSRRDDRLDYERNRDGGVEFDAYGVSFESEDGDIELQDEDVDFETDDDRDELELTIDHGGVSLDLEMSDGGDQVELTVAAGGEYIDFEVDGLAIEFEAIGDSETFEDDNREIEYKGDAIGFEWDTESQELDITGDVALELKTDGELDFEYQDDDYMIDYDTSELEYMGLDVSLEWEDGDGDDDEFEARRL